MAVNEEVFYEGGPHIGDLLFGIVLVALVITLPLGVAAIARALWVRYRISDRRITITGGFLGRDRTDVIYAEITKIVKVARGLGGWGDMVLTLKDGSRLEIRSIPRFREAFDFMEQRLTLKAQGDSGAVGSKA
ncbi:MAG: PH domain-containing protein [Oscillatoriales cyanobacterium SM2_2_1]|nr:PH domain-containing protein [Oscillatoriales cyanobacterium SM2_2_1]